MGEGLTIYNDYTCLSLQVLGHSTRQSLSTHLDYPAEIVNDEGLTPDVFGLAELAGFDSTYIRKLETKSNKTVVLLDAWSRKPSGTIAKLLEFLNKLGRYDCVSDITKSLERDIENWRNKEGKEENAPPQAPVDVIPRQSRKEKVNVPPVEDHLHPPQRQFSHESALTTDDGVDGYQSCYVACICCSDEDLDIAHTIINKYREVTNTVQFFLPQEMLLGGKYEYESLAEVIEERCDGRLLVIMSKTYVSSPACIFSLQFVKSLDPDAKMRKIVPILKDEDATYPRVLRGINAIKLQRLKFSDAFWKILSTSLSIPAPASQNDSKSSLSSSSNYSSSELSSMDRNGCAKSPNQFSPTPNKQTPIFGRSNSNIRTMFHESNSNIRTRSDSVESIESVIDNEQVPVSNELTKRSNEKQIDHIDRHVCAKSGESRVVSSTDYSRETNSETSRQISTCDSFCSGCNPGTVKKSGRKFVSKLMKTFKLRSKSSNSNSSCAEHYGNRRRPMSEPVNILRRSSQSCDDLFAPKSERGTSKLHYLRNIVTSVTTSRSKDVKQRQQHASDLDVDKLSTQFTSCESFEDKIPTSGQNIPWNIQMERFNIISREYSVDSNSETGIMRSASADDGTTNIGIMSRYVDDNTETAIMRSSSYTSENAENVTIHTSCSLVSIEDNDTQPSL